MKNSQKGSIVIILLVSVLLIAGGVTAYSFISRSQCTDGCGKDWGVPKDLIGRQNASEDKLLCEDTDNGDNYYAKGQVNFSEPLTLKEGGVVKVLSAERANIRMGTTTSEVSVGGTYSFVEPDQVYYQKADQSNGSVMVNIPVTYVIKKINFVNVGSSENSVSLVRKSVQEDVCISNILIENSCVRGINNGYVCPKGCNQGACIK